jgi:hypothetical protein
MYDAIRAFVARSAAAMLVGSWVPVAVDCSRGGAASASPNAENGTALGGIAGATDAGIVGDDAGHRLAAFVSPPADPGPGTVLVTASGEVNAISGYPFPPFDADQTWMVDGWSWHISEYIVVIDHITLSNPDLNLADPSQVGSTVAQIDGPFVVDLHKAGPLAGQGGGGERAVAIASFPASQLPNQTTPYAFGFSTVAAPADYDATNINLDPSEAADYAYMAANGYSVLYVGTAVWAGDVPGTSGGFDGTCTQTDVTTGPVDDDGDGGNGSTDGAYDFSRLPPAMTFRLGFSTPTNYVNCVNFTVSEQTNTTVYGVQVSPSDTVIAQVTIHMDHPFWESFAENSPVHWDQIAARYIGFDGGADGAVPEAHTEDLKGVPFSPFTDATGALLPWRNCAPTGLYTSPDNAAMDFSTLSVPVDPSGTCAPGPGNCPAIRDYYDYIRYTQSTQGHLNSQGLCYISRQYPAPPGGS